MAKIQKINKSRKEWKCSKCGKVINIGEPYLKAEPYMAKPIIRCCDCGLKVYETSGSEFVQRVGRVVEDWRENYELTDSTAEDIANELEEVRDMVQDSLDNMPESLQEADTGQLLQERVDMLDGVIDELNTVEYEADEEELYEEVAAELGEFNSESKYKTEEEYNKAIDEKVEELKEEKLEEYADAIDEALSSLEY